MSPKRDSTLSSRAASLAFPDGVCDYSKLGVGQDAKMTPWAMFSDDGVYAGL